MQTYESPYEWPRFDDGGLVRVGDDVEYQGAVRKVEEVAVGKKGWTMLLDPQGLVFAGDPVRRPFRDTQEAIDADAEQDCCAYFGLSPFDCSPECRAYGESCYALKTRELLRRQRELDAREAAKGGGR